MGTLCLTKTSEGTVGRRLSRGLLGTGDHKCVNTSEVGVGLILGRHTGYLVSFSLPYSEGPNLLCSVKSKVEPTKEEESSETLFE